MLRVQEERIIWHLPTVFFLLAIIRTALVMSVGVYKIVFMIGFIGIASAAMLVSDKKYCRESLKWNVFYGIVLFAVTYLYCMMLTVEKSIFYAKEFNNNVLILMLYWFTYSYIRSVNTKTRNFILYFYLVLIVISLVYTLFFVSSYDGDFIRENTTGINEQGRFRVGGFDFIYATVLIYIAIISSIRNVKGKKIKKIFFIFLEILIFVVVAKSAYSTAFVLIVGFTLFEILPNRNKWIYIIIALIILRYMLNIIADIIYDWRFLPDLTRVRLSSILRSLTGSETTGVSYYTGKGQRFDRMIWSLRIFAEHPFIGGFLGKTKNSFGWHTEWVDTLARYGVFVTSLLVAFWKNTYMNIKNSIISRNRSLEPYKRTFIAFVILGFLNPISVVVTCAPLFILAPFINDLLSGNKEEKESNESK